MKALSDAAGSYEQHLTGPLKQLTRQHGVRIGLVLSLGCAYTVLALFFHIELGIGIAYSHLAYLPIILTGIWWGRRALLAAVLLGMVVIGLHLAFPHTGTLWSCLIRVASFLSVGVVVGELSRRTMKAQRNLREANIRLNSLSRIQRDFLHITVHDLNSPIAASIALLHGLKALLVADRAPREVHLIDRAMARLEEVTSSLRNFQFFAALDSASIREQAARTQVGPIVERLVDSAGELAEKKGHRLVLDIEEDLPPVTAIGWLLSEVVMNLITNAVKYTPDGGTITVRAFSRDSAVWVEVRDNGIGISREDQEGLFKEFVRVRRSMKPGEKIPGIGLGLSIVKRVVELHGGRVHLDSTPGEGSAFSFELPPSPPGDGPVALPEPEEEV